MEVKGVRVVCFFAHDEIFLMSIATPKNMQDEHTAYTPIKGLGASLAHRRDKPGRCLRYKRIGGGETKGDDTC